MTVARRLRTYSLAGALLAAPCPAYLLVNSGPLLPDARQTPEARDGQHDFDFEFGSWKAHVRILQEPLTGSTTWTDFEGTSVVRKVWGGRANLGELAIKSATTEIQGLSLRLYNPESRQWSIRWANSKDGELGPPMIGRFTDGRGEFFNQEMYRGRAIYVRFIFSNITPSSFRLEQAFSETGGMSWEPNWIATFTRQPQG